MAVAVIFLLHCAVFMSVPSDQGPAYARGHLPLDDAWIHLSYAKNLLSYGYFTYNPGEVETGATSPLWAAVLAAALALLRRPVLAAHLAGMLAGAVCSALVFRELRRIGGRVAGWTGALLLALDPMWIMGCLSGMEIPLTGLLLVAALAQVRRGRPVACGLTLGLLVLARPEMAPPAAAAGALLLWSLWRRGRGRGIAWTAVRGGAVRCAAAALAISLPWFLYCRLGTGHWLPCTFYVKGKTAWQLGWEQARTIYQMLEHHYWPSPLVHDPVCLGLLVLGVGFVLARRRPAAAGWLLLPLAHLCGWSLVSGSGDSGGHAGQYLTFVFTRYYLPDYALMFGVAGLGAGVLGRGLGRLGARLQTGLAPRAERLLRRSLAGVVIALLAGGSFVGWWTYVGPLWQLGDGYAVSWFWNAKYNAESCRNIYEIHERMGQWIARNVPLEATVATQDAGAIRYFTRQRLIDLWGLNSHGYLFAPDKAAYLRRAGLKVAVIFPQGRLDPLHDFTTRRLLMSFSSFPNRISEDSVMEAREVR